VTGVRRLWVPNTWGQKFEQLKAVLQPRRNVVIFVRDCVYVHVSRGLTP